MVFHHNVDMEELDIGSEMIDIISIISKGSLFFEIAMIDKDTALIYMDNCFYWLKKVSNETDNYYADEQKNQQNHVERTEAQDNLLRSGVLIGLRSTVPSTNEEDIFSERSSYRTIWISSYNRDIKSTLEVPNLFIPRKWFLDLEVK